MPAQRPDPAVSSGKTYAYVVGASEYGGPGDPSSGHIGASGKDLTGTMSFAELGMGHLLGDLPMGTKLHIYNMDAGKLMQVVAEKQDIGLGGTPVQGHSRRVDLWYETAKALGFRGTGLIVISRVDGKPIVGPNDTNVKKYLGKWNTETSQLEKEAIGGPLLAVGEGIEGAAKGAGLGFLGELSFKKILLALVALGLGAFALLWLSHDLTGGKLP